MGGDGFLPRLPQTTLSIKYADREPSLATRAQVRTMAGVLSDR